MPYNSTDMTAVYVSVYPKTGGGRITSYVVGIHGDDVNSLINKGETEHPESVCLVQSPGEWMVAVDDGLHYDEKTQALVEPPKPTEEEIRASALAILDCDYEQKISDVELEMAKAQAIEDSDLFEMLKSDREALVSEYIEKRGAL